MKSTNIKGRLCNITFEVMIKDVPIGLKFVWLNLWLVPPPDQWDAFIDDDAGDPDKNWPIRKQDVGHVTKVAN